MPRSVPILVLLSILTLFAGLGRGAIGDSDEAFYAEAAREMVESGDWLTPFYNYEHRFQKPILFYWLVAGAYSIAGVTEAAARFPAACSGLGLVLLTWAAGRQRYGDRTGRLAGVIAATSFGYFNMARVSLPDLPLAFFIVLATWAGLDAVGSAGREDPGVRSRVHRLYLAAVAAGLAFLTKGPVGLALPILIVGTVQAVDIVRHRRRPAALVPLPWVHLGLAVAVFALVAFPWYAAMTAEHGFAYLERFFIDENVERFATDRYNEPRPIWFYLPIVAGGLVPWTPFLALAIVPAWRFLRGKARLGGLETELLLWAGLPLVFYSLSIGKQPRYILPVLPPLAILIARAIVLRVEIRGDATRRDRLMAFCGGASGVLLLVLGFLLHRAKPLLFALDPSVGLVATTLIVISGVVVLFASWLGRPRVLLVTLAGAAAVTLLALHYSVYTAAGLEPVQRVAAAFAANREGLTASCTHRVFVRNLVFYTGMKQRDLGTEAEVAKFLSSPEKVFCAIREDHLASIRAAHDLPPLRVLVEVSYFNPSAVRVRTLLWPDPARDLDTVLLVSNR